MIENKVLKLLQKDVNHNIKENEIKIDKIKFIRLFVKGLISKD
jgi:hypothetical protein